MHRPRLLLAVALPEEAFTWTPKRVEVSTVYTGVGKAAAALAVTEGILTHRPDAVINVGTAGTLSHHLGDILVCRHFVDRDLAPLAIDGLASDLTALSSSALPYTFTSCRQAAEGEHDDADTFTLSTGDSFVTQAEQAVGDVVDMEGFAEALVCQHFHIPFLSIKYVTDIIGQNSVMHWQQKLQHAREGLSAYFRRYE